MTSDDAKLLKADPDGLHTYEFIANNIETIEDSDLDSAVENLVRVDLNGQFTASAARYLHAIDAQRYSGPISALAAATIEKDREHRYLAELLAGLYGADYRDRATELSASDNNFRRIYKRLFPNPDSL